MIPVYNGKAEVLGEAREIIGEVEYTDNLDHWDGSNYTSGSTGRHKGLARWNDKYVLVHGTQWQGERDYGEVITSRQAVQEILQAGKQELFEEFPELQAVREDMNAGKNKSQYVSLRIDEATKKRWQGIAEAAGLTLTDWIIKQVEKK